MRDNNMKLYPECFPEDFESSILPAGAKKERKSVYRIIKSGKLDRNSFISTYEEMERKLIPPKRNVNLQDPGLYSTSCNIEYEEAEYALNIFMRHYPKPFIAKGVTEVSCGPCQLTSEREKHRADSHVDWWIYEKSTPQLYFKEVSNDEK